jgi:DNA-binding MarR family transcriptional regulator
VPTPTDPAVALTRYYSWWRRSSPSSSLSSTSLSTLDALDVRGPQRLSDLATRERISQPGMTGLVTRLATAGLVERTSDPDDGRVARVRVTDAGRRALTEFRDTRSAELRRRLEHLDPQDQRALELAVPALERLMSGDPA